MEIPESPWQQVSDANVRVRVRTRDETEMWGVWVSMQTLELTWIQEVKTSNQSLWRGRGRVGGP